ncbi:MAG: HEPN domain-containing protein [Candidatus Cloacimonetes bacterium]|nr:HEPN domain-containing protein [Candidatus Cloacimonadota bacterium]
MEKNLRSEVRLRLERAFISLGSAKNSLDGAFYGDSISSAYYAMFHATKALIILEGKDAKTHSGVIQIFNQQFVQTGEIEKYVADKLRQAQNARTLSDYEYEFIPTREKAGRALDEAKEFVQILTEHLKEHYKITPAFSNNSSK